MPPRGSGAYMLPITYEVHCLACHPLTFDSKKETVAVPHRLQPDHIHDFLRGFYANEALSENPAFFERRVPSKRPLPGKVALDEDVTLRKAIADKVVLAEKTLYLGKRTCGECHHYEEPGLISPKRIVPTKVPTIWFEHAKFDHLPHRSVTCRECHPKAYGTDGSGKMTHTGSTLSSDILIPGIDNCLRCHAPSTKSAGGARFDCVECHRYHNGDNPLQGLGAKARSPK